MMAQGFREHTSGNRNPDSKWLKQEKDFFSQITKMPGSKRVHNLLIYSLNHPKEVLEFSCLSLMSPSASQPCTSQPTLAATCPDTTGEQHDIPQKRHLFLWPFLHRRVCNVTEHLLRPTLTGDPDPFCFLFQADFSNDPALVMAKD